ncbi:MULTISPECIES: L,D-transpeptidase family protein [unclassified Psychrobacter]|uniref:L,D-transpeptidase family protein n=1 Tax=unclassified Psychrobacter TaxID=196806 RepID=UPI0018F783D4|nr:MULTISPECIES: L,D-transpeptidase family protein [unclassified Psychrobacter]
MYKLNKLSQVMLAMGTSAILLVGCNGGSDDANAQPSANDTTAQTTTDTQAAANQNDMNNGSDMSQDNAAMNAEQDMNTDSEMPADIDKTLIENGDDISPVTRGINQQGVSQQLEGNSKTENELNKLLPSLEYNTDNLSERATKANESTWTESAKIDQNLGTKIQALLNWNHHGVGAVDGRWGKNTIKAMKAFQEANNLPVTDSMNTETWKALTQDSALIDQPVLVNYQLTDNDVNIKTTKIPSGAEEKAKLEGMYYESVLEALGEKFHMDTDYLKALNPDSNFAAGETIIVYNPGNPDTTPVSRVVADKAAQTLYAYDANDNMVASYPTTVGSTATPSPTGTHKVKVKIHKPNYTYTSDAGKKSILSPGPNNPVGIVWIGLTKPSYGIHGSPDPERISRQASAGCVRLTNWDALALLGTIEDGATVEFK